MNALRLVDGVDPALFERRTGLSLATIAPVLARARQRGLLAGDPDAIRPSELGQRFLNDLLTLFLPR
jgi:oxygen-independent coproporphyrinogen-3 oxidase